MRIESIAIPDVALKDRASIEANPEEFSKALTKAINVEGENKKAGDSDLKEEAKQSEEDISHLLAGLINFGMIQTKPIVEDISQIEPELLMASRDDVVEGIDLKGISNLLKSEDKSLTIEDTLKTFDMDLSPEEILALEGDENLSAKDRLQLFSINQPNVDDNKLNSKELSLGDDSEVSLTDFNYSSKNMVSESDLSISKDANISLMNEEMEGNKELEQPKIDSHLLDMDVNILNKGSIKDLNEMSIESKTSSTVLSTDNLKNINEAVINLSEITQEGQSNILKVKLYPEDLGTIDVTVSMENGKISAKITVDNEHIRGLFTNSLNELSAGLAKENINIGKINVDINNSNFNLSRDNPGFNMNQQGNFNNNRGYLLKNYKGGLSTISKEARVEAASNIGSGKLSILA